VIVTVLVDLGVKYLSKVFSPLWLNENGLNIEAGDGEENGNGEQNGKENGEAHR